MADVSTYRRCIEAFQSPTKTYHAGDIEPASNPDVSQNPLYWIAMTDANIVSGSENDPTPEDT